MIGSAGDNHIGAVPEIIGETIHIIDVLSVVSRRKDNHHVFFAEFKDHILHGFRIAVLCGPVP